MINCWIDGSVTEGPWGKKGTKHLPARCWSAWIVKDQDNNHLHHHAFAHPPGDSLSGNVAEWASLMSLLKWLGQNGYREQTIKIHTDSQLVCNQMSGKFQVHDARLKVFKGACDTLASLFPRIEMTWIRREYNQEADFLSKAINPDHGFGGCVPDWQVVIANTRK